ncbi:MAG: MBOAT family protein [Clostridiales bacterium]|nr:MBOAT family protein [Clostridiales bacterium]
MVFSDLLFVFAFFPLNMLFYWLMPDIPRKNRVLLIFSLIFYAWAGPMYLLLLVGMAFADYVVALQVERCKTRRSRKLVLAAGCTINLTLLCIFKYLTFLLENIQFLFGVPSEIVEITLPIGISFYTFQLLSYMVDVYRGTVRAQRKFTTLLLYVSLFHQCIAGPIVRYETVERELTSRSVSSDDLAYGIRRFTVGLAKKALFANYCSSLADTFLVATDAADGAATLATQPALSILLGTVCYTLQIYLDFSAYSDMAIGMGRMVGFHYLENFLYPYQSTSITEFWRRWHVSLSSFFRDYLYIPLGGSRCKRSRIIFNTLVVWVCTGFWHGASWNYMLWGLFYFAMLCLEKFVFPNFTQRMPRVAAHLYVLLVVNFGWMLFRCENLSWLGIELKGLLGLNGNGFVNYETLTTLKANFIFLLAAALACTPLVKRLGERLTDWCQRSLRLATVYQTVLAVIPVALTVVATACLVGDSYNPFLYFRF